MSVFIILLIGIISGWLARQIWNDSGFGLIWNMIVGIIGSFVGVLFGGYLGVGGGGFLFLIGVSILGSWIFLFLLSLIKG